MITMQDAVLELVEQYQAGNQSALDELFRQQRPFIYKTTKRICKRNVDWDKDDELSIALIAFHEAVEKYEPGKGAHLLTFAHKVIQQRLIDYFRKEERHHHLPIDAEKDEEEVEVSKIERDKAMDDHLRKQEQQEMAATLAEFEERLTEFGISMEDLVDASPKHRDTRDNLLELAKIISHEDDLLSSLKEKKRLPVKEVVKRVKVSRKVLERGRKYLIAMIIIITERQFASLKEFGGIA